VKLMGRDKGHIEGEHQGGRPTLVATVGQAPETAESPNPTVVPFAAISHLPVLDTAVVERLATTRAPGQGSLAEVALTMFLEGTPAQFAELQGALECGDGSRVWQVAHRLKGEANTIGADQLAALCAQLEALVQADRLTQAGPFVAALPAALERVRAAWLQVASLA